MPEKDGILACLLVAEMMAARGAPLDEQLRDLFRRVGREYWPLRANLHLPDDVKARAVERLSGDFSEFFGRRVARTDRTDGLKLVFDDGVVDVAAPVRHRAADARLHGSRHTQGVRADRRGGARSGFSRPRQEAKVANELAIAQHRTSFWSRHAREQFWASRCCCWPFTTFSGAHGFLAMRRTQKEIEQTSRRHRRGSIRKTRS